MSIIALHQAYDGPGAVRFVMSGLLRWRRLMLAFALVFPVVFYLLLLAVLVIEYGHLPNYVTPYDWISNVLRIIAGTRSVADMVSIILDEWLIEIGRMNFDYGHGIADWSLSIIPHKLAIVSLVGALIGLNVGLLLDRQSTGTLLQQCVQACRTGFLTSAGALCASLTSVTVFSVVHCATPSWVGSLAILGLDSSAAFAMEPFGPIATVLGLVALAVSAVWIVRDNRTAETPAPLRLRQGALS